LFAGSKSGPVALSAEINNIKEIAPAPKKSGKTRKETCNFNLNQCESGDLSTQWPPATLARQIAEPLHRLFVANDFQLR
jgi:hypothetical protein